MAFGLIGWGILTVMGGNVIGGMWLAFIPPQRYLDWVLAHAGTEA